MPDRVRIELFEAEDVRRLLNDLPIDEDDPKNCNLAYITNVGVEDLVNAIGEIYEAALIRIRRAALE